MTKEAAARAVASIAGEMSLALIRPVTDVAVVQRWIDTLRRVADALQARVGAPVREQQ